MHCSHLWTVGVGIRLRTDLAGRARAGRPEDGGHANSLSASITYISQFPMSFFTLLLDLASSMRLLGEAYD